MNRVCFALRRLRFIAQNTLREAVRQKIFLLLLVLALGLVAGAQFFREFHFGSHELKFLADVGFGAIAGFGSVLAVVATAQLFFSEIERRTILTLLAKPVSRAEFVLGKFAGVAVLTAVFCGGLTALLAGVLWVRESTLMRELPDAFAGGGMINYAHVAVVGLMQWLKLVLLSALTLLVASYAQTQLFTVVMGFVVWVICHLQHLAQAASSRPGASGVRVIVGWVAHALPDFQVFNLGEILGGDRALPWSYLELVLIYAGAYIVVACALAVFCFRRREL